MSEPDFFEPSREELDRMSSYRRTTTRSNDPFSPNYTAETEEQIARRIFRTALPQAAKEIVDIAVGSTNDRTRLQAAQYIVERNLGKVGDDPAHASDDLLRGIVEDFTREIEGRA
jgi:hypothetical protein